MYFFHFCLPPGFFTPSSGKNPFQLKKGFFKQGLVGSPTLACTMWACTYAAKSAYLQVVHVSFRGSFSLLFGGLYGYGVGIKGYVVSGGVLRMKCRLSLRVFLKSRQLFLPLCFLSWLLERCRRFLLWCRTCLQAHV